MGGRRAATWSVRSSVFILFAVLRPTEARANDVASTITVCVRDRVDWVGVLGMYSQGGANHRSTGSSNRMALLLLRGSPKNIN